MILWSESDRKCCCSNHVVLIRTYFFLIWRTMHFGVIGIHHRINTWQKLNNIWIQLLCCKFCLLSRWAKLDLWRYSFWIRRIILFFIYLTKYTWKKLFPFYQSFLIFFIFNWWTVLNCCYRVLSRIRTKDCLCLSVLEWKYQCVNLFMIVHPVFWLLFRHFAVVSSCAR